MPQETTPQEKMSQETWNAVDQYYSGLLVKPDPALDAALKASDAAGLPTISVAPNQGKMLFLLARLMGARRILELGTPHRLRADSEFPRAHVATSPRARPRRMRRRRPKR